MKEQLDSMQNLNLLHLADELLMLILDYTSSSNDLYSLMRVCHRLSSLAEPKLYASILLRDVQDEMSFVASLANHPERALHIRSFEQDIILRENFKPVPIIHLLALMENLLDLSIYSLEENNVSFDEVLNRALAPNLTTNPLWSLRTCTFKYYYYWNLSNKAAIFLHPTLQSLIIINAVASELEMRNLPAQAASTSLEGLHFHHCDIHPRSLADVLVLPRALKHLTINQFRYFPPREDRPEAMNDYVLAMASQYEYLENLTAIWWREGPYSPLKLENLSSLRSLEINSKILITSFDTSPPIVNAADRIIRILPPGLREIALEGSVHEDYMRSLLMLRTILDMKSEKKIVSALERIIVTQRGHQLLPTWFRTATAAADVHLAMGKGRTRRLNREAAQSLHRNGTLLLF